MYSWIALIFLRQAKASFAEVIEVSGPAGSQSRPRSRLSAGAMISRDPREPLRRSTRVAGLPPVSGGYAEGGDGVAVFQSDLPRPTRLVSLDCFAVRAYFSTSGRIQNQVM